MQILSTEHTLPTHKTVVFAKMTSWDTFCFLTTLHMREEEIEAAEKAKQQANMATLPGDSAKGAKLFQVSCEFIYIWLLFCEGDGDRLT